MLLFKDRYSNPNILGKKKPQYDEKPEVKK